MQINNEEMNFDFSYILKTLYKRLPIIILILIIGLMGAGLYTYNAPILYRSSATIYVKPMSLGETNIKYDDILSSNRLVKSYIEIIKSRRIINKSLKELELDLSYNEVSKNLGVNAYKDTELINISYTDKSNVQAPKIANSVANTFIEDLKEDMGIENIEIIDLAVKSNIPVSPNLTFNMFIGAFGALLIAIFIVFILESMDNNIKNYEDIKKYLHIKNIGTIPFDEGGKGKKNGKKHEELTNVKIVNDPKSIFAEAIRMIRTNLNFLDLKVINVTSTIPGEGKSGVIANLAVSFAMTGKKVLLIDCDIRKPVVHKIFHVFRGAGICDLVLKPNELKPQDVIKKFNISDSCCLDIIPAGGRVSNPSELLNSQSFKRTIENIKADYDLILIDAPPTSMVTDSVIVSKISDGTLYIIESNRVDYRVVNSCIEQLKNAEVFVLGTILNKVNLKSEKKLYGYGYYEYYDE